MLIDLLVHCRLREARLIALVVTVTPVADEIDHEVLLELLAIGERGPGGLDACHRVIRIDMHHRNLESCCHIAGMKSAAGLVFVGGKAELVVGNDMDRSTHCIAGYPRK